MGLIYVAQSLTATVAAALAYVSLRSEPEWRGVRVASRRIVVPWGIYLLGEIIVLRDPLEALKGATDFFAGMPTLAPVAVSVGIAAASCWRWHVHRGSD